METGFWIGPDRVKVREGGLRLLSAREVLEARREGDALARDGRERALCRNACLIARALERKGRPVFEDGEAVLNALRVEDIARLAGVWAEFNRDCNPSALDGERELERRKKAWSTRLMSAFNGACSVCSALCPPRNGQKNDRPGLSVVRPQPESGPGGGAGKAVPRLPGAGGAGALPRVRRAQGELVGEYWV